MDEENASSTNSIKLELSVYMHCDACERSVRQVIKNTGGVDKVEVDREENKVTVTGDFDPEKVVKRIKKRTGKKAEVLVPEEEEDGGGGEGEGADASHESCMPPDNGGGGVAHELQRPARSDWDLHSFDDENTQACRVM
uniref:HMA domain-containing protein n=1 Tax=Oryza brachyantha TaxID=4533 RepID=J3LZB9_ORYBR